ncbi:hypothetical protein [Blastococcus brunescens]|uniref:Uncharacterized protein n=1 Tax=Blastococcus brunescens TaxID=1564165 RepID=A0ABZ1B3L9_9ACTN|nr:hypothetical protein [Blastococcus sp. BMG 8361]WRL64321.1 hypothetical protein U6N30_00160 [Blastococcus sp. BMG 8361]
MARVVADVVEGSSSPGRRPVTADGAAQLPRDPVGSLPRGLPDRTDLTVIEAFDDAWLLIEHAQESPK